MASLTCLFDFLSTITNKHDMFLFKMSRQPKQ